MEVGDFSCFTLYSDIFENMKKSLFSISSKSYNIVKITIDNNIPSDKKLLLKIVV